MRKSAGSGGPRGGVIAGAVVFVLMAIALIGVEKIVTSAFDELEADQVAQDAQRVRTGLDGWTALLRNYGATNSIWDDSFEAVRTGDTEAFDASFPPADLVDLYGLDGVLGVGPDGAPRVGGIAAGDTYAAAPAGLADATALAALFDPAAPAGTARCGVVTTSADPYLYCGFAAHRSDAGPDVSGGLIFLRSLGDASLAVLSGRLGLEMSLAQGLRPGAIAAGPVSSDLGELAVRTASVSADTMALQVDLPAVAGDVVTLEALRPRQIHAVAVSVAYRLMVVMVVLAAVFFGAVLLVMRGEVRRQVGPLRRTAEQVIASGDRSLRVACATGGEIGALAASIDQMLDAMSAQDEALRVEQEDRQEQVRHTYVQQRLARQHVRRRAQEAMDSTAALVLGELSDVVAQVAAVRESVSTIDDRVRRTGTTTQRVREGARGGISAAEAVAGSVDRVSGIARLIAGVADQTNLLSLNATIEAARAGAAGKGFAVVAGEVKQLAAETSTSTGEISQVLAELERDVAAMSGVISTMTDGVVDIDQQTGELGQVAQVQREAMSRLEDAVRSAMARISELTTVSEAVERRSHQRVLVDGMAVITADGGGAPVEGELVDISEGGLRCTVPQAPAFGPGTRVSVQVSLGHRTQRLVGEVVRAVPADGRFDVAVRFSANDAAAQGFVGDYVEAVLAALG